jgi:hypothetical protein
MSERKIVWGTPEHKKLEAYSDKWSEEMDRITRSGECGQTPICRQCSYGAVRDVLAELILDESRPLVAAVVLAADALVDDTPKVYGQIWISPETFNRLREAVMAYREAREKE